MHLLLCFYLFLMKIKSKCQSECEICDDDVCLKCIDGYGLETDINHKFYGICFNCSRYNPHCTACSNSVHICTRCEDENYTLDTDIYSHTRNKCIPCPKNCLNCKNIEYGKCWTCVDGYGPDENHKCLKCIDPNCLKCNKDNSRCTKCKVGYRNTENGNCQKCEDPNCLSCQNSASFCDECGEGTYSEFNDNKDYSGKCNYVKLKDENCIKGYSKTDHSFWCTSCMEGYGLINGKCEKCQNQYCQHCNRDVTKCQLCFFNSTRDENFECVPCTLFNDKCTFCSYNNIAKYCISCEDGFIPTDDTKCEKSVIENCNWQDNGACSSCIEGFGFNEDKTQCIKCELENCLHCNPNYKRCTECIKNKKCEICDESGSCTSCASGYLLKDKKCKKCGLENCDYCPENEDTQCYKCSAGFQTTLFEYQCVQCDDINCGDCQEKITECSSCKEGFGLDYRKGNCHYGKCTKCSIENCINCNGNPTYCYECDVEHPNCFENSPKDDDVYDGECPEVVIESSTLDIEDDKIDKDKTTIMPETQSKSNDVDNDDNNNNNNNDNNGETKEKKKKLPAAAIAGIVIGCVVVVGVVVGLLIYFLAIKKKKVGISSSN